MIVFSRRLAAAGAALALVVMGITPAGAAPAPEGIPDVNVSAPAEYNEQELARGGSGGFTCHRIPALTTANDGTVLASWDGRPDNCGDAPNPNSIVLRTSDDNGSTWSDIEVIAQGVKGADKVGYSDPSFVVDRETGEIFNFFVKSYDNGWHQSTSVPNNDRQIMHAVYISSKDHGKTWSEPVEVTDALNPGGEHKQWTSKFAASGEGIQLRYGAHKGRLIQQFTVRDISKSGGFYAVSLYSDDHGATWQAGNPVGPGMDENKTVELSDGRVMLNSRSSGGGGARLVGFSNDGGINYSKPVLDHNLPDPTNNGSIMRAFPNAPQGSAEAKVLLFSNANSTSSRSNGIVRVSYDDGKSWPDSSIFQPGSMSYSTLTMLGDGSLGLLYEHTGSTIYFARFTFQWLDPAGISITVNDAVVNRGNNTFPVEIQNSGFAGALPTGTLVASDGSGVTGGSVDVPAIPDGQSVTVDLPVTVASLMDPGTIILNTVYTAGEFELDRNLLLEVEVKEGESLSQAISQSEMSVADSSPAHVTQPASNMLDGKVGTVFHTPWAGMELPGSFTIDLGTERSLTSFTVSPRTDGLNGTIGEYEIWTGTDLEEMTKHSDGTWPANSTPRSIYMDGETVRYVQVKALTSYGDTPNKWISVAEFTAKEIALGSDLPQQISVEVSLLDDLKDSYQVGDKLRAGFKIENLSDQAVHVQPVSDGWEGLAACQWRNLAVDADFTCGLPEGPLADTPPTYTITEADLNRGVVDLSQNWRVSVGTDTTWATPIQIVESSGPQVNLGIQVINAGPVSVPDPIEVGAEIKYTFDYQNNTTGTVAVIPHEGEFSGFLTSGTPNCRWAGLAPGQSASCSTATYTVTEEDMAAGLIAPDSRFLVAVDREGTQPLFYLDVAAPAIEFDVDGGDGDGDGGDGDGDGDGGDGDGNGSETDGDGDGGDGDGNGSETDGDGDGSETDGDDNSNVTEGDDPATELPTTGFSAVGPLVLMGVLLALGALTLIWRKRQV